MEGVLLVKKLKHDLLSVSKLCYKGYSIVFDALNCLIKRKESKSLVFKGSRVDNVYFLDLDDVSMYSSKCLATRNEDSWLCHRCLEHVHFDFINKIPSKNLVLPKIFFF